LLPVAMKQGGVLFPECETSIFALGEAVDSVRKVEAQQLPLLGYVNVNEAGQLMPVGTLALLKNVKWMEEGQGSGIYIEDIGEVEIGSDDTEEPSSDEEVFSLHRIDMPLPRASGVPLGLI